MTTFTTFSNHMLGISDKSKGTVRWASDQVTWAPEIAVEGLHVTEIGGYMEGVYS